VQPTDLHELSENEILELLNGLVNPNAVKGDIFQPLFDGIRIMFDFNGKSWDICSLTTRNFTRWGTRRTVKEIIIDEYFEGKEKLYLRFTDSLNQDFRHSFILSSKHINHFHGYAVERLVYTGSEHQTGEFFIDNELSDKIRKRSFAFVIAADTLHSHTFTNKYGEKVLHHKILEFGDFVKISFDNNRKKTNTLVFYNNSSLRHRKDNEMYRNEVASLYLMKNGMQQKDFLFNVIQAIGEQKKNFREAFKLLHNLNHDDKSKTIVHYLKQIIYFLYELYDPKEDSKEADIFKANEKEQLINFKKNITQNNLFRIKHPKAYKPAQLVSIINLLQSSQHNKFLPHDIVTAAQELNQIRQIDQISFI